MHTMLIGKHRGKSAVPLPNGNAAPSPLKIESVLPTLHRSSAKSIYRSYSTLSIGNTKATEDTTTSPPNAELRLQNAQPSPSGFWHIQRTAHEKLKLPDRINLDRRGLTAMPIIDDEPQLRLLSLQHNLINSFCVPEPVDRPPEVKEPAMAQHSADHDVNLRHNNRAINNGPTRKSATKSHQLLAQRPSTRNLLAKSTVQNGQPHNGLLNPKLAPNCQVTNTFIQKSVLLHAKQRYAFRRSSSFINHYSQHLAASKVPLGRLMDASQAAKMNMTSFSTDSGISDVESKTSPTIVTKTLPANGIPTNSALLSSTTTTVPTSPPPILHGNPLESLIIRNEAGLPVSDLQNLVFIDLYDNQIEKISSLLGLKSLTVLLLGKNRINDISGLNSVKKTLRVLDLHGNKITSIAHKICQLQELKSLNLAGNSLKTVHAEDFKGLFNLRELNLKRNKIKRVNGFDDLRNLERLWLCHNDLQKVEDMSCIAKAVNLKEVTIENNPVSLGGDCVSFLVSYLPGLVLLSQMQVTEQVRRAAMAWRKSKETSDTNFSHLSSDVSQSQRREEIISNARTNWELLRTQHPQVTAIRTGARRSNRTQHGAPVSDLDMDLSSDISNRSKSGDRKAAIVLARQKTIANRVRTLKRTTHGRNLHKRSVSQENPTLGTDFFRLPPILAPFVADGMHVNKESPLTSTSGSSFSPNIDSSSSCMSTDNEEEKVDEFLNSQNADPADENEILVAQIIDEVKEDIETRIEPTNIALPASYVPSTIEVSDTASIAPGGGGEDPIAIRPDDLASAKLSKPSSTSGKATNHSDAKHTEESSKTTRTRSVLPTRRFIAPLTRAQTARSTSHNAQPPNGGGSNHAAVPATSAKPSPAVKIATPTSNLHERDREQGGDYLIEICGRYLNVYGIGAIKFIDRQWNVQKASDVHTVKFSYVHFNSIATILSKIKLRFPNAENFVFRETNINCLGQLNALAEVQGIHSLIIDPEGNLVCRKSDWRMYAIYRLSHWGVKVINGDDVTEAEKAEAQQKYAGLSDLVLWSLPDALLEPLLARLRLDETCLASKMTPKQWLMKADESLRNVVGKEALQWKKGSIGGCQTPPDEVRVRQQGQLYFRCLMENTCNAVEKLHNLETMWPTMLVELIRNTLLDYAQLDVYVRNMLADLAASKSNSIVGSVKL